MREQCFAGIDIGGTKCAVVLGYAQEGEIHVLHKERFATLKQEPDNGGSCADSEHIVGELMKGFLKKRPLSAGLSYNLCYG